MADDPIRRARQWKAFYEEDGGLRDMIQTIKATYLQRIIDADPRHAAIMANMKIGYSVAESFEGMIKTIMTDGKVAEASQAHADKIAAIPDSKRRFI